MKSIFNKLIQILSIIMTTMMTKMTTNDPQYKFYQTLEDMIYDIQIQENQELLPAPPVEIEKISGTKDLLDYIQYIKDHSLFKYNLVYKYLLKAEEPIRELNNMIGMDNIKASIANQIIYYAKKLAQGNGNLDLDNKTVVYLNTAIYGAPGTGKTTIARIIGKLYRKLGVAINDKFIVGRRDNMIGKYLGQTAPTTMNVIKSAEGGVLFLDEVYQFGSNSSNQDSFAKEVVDTINQYITDHPGKVIFIVAGYRDQVKACFFSQNEGLERRFRWSYTIEKYNPYDLLQIFYKQAHELAYTIVAQQLLLPNTPEVSMTNDGKRKRFESSGIEFFTLHKDDFKYGGGDTETFLDKCIMIHEKRTILSNKDQGKINDVDIDLALKEYLEYIKDRTHKQHSAPPDGMYI